MESTYQHYYPTIETNYPAPGQFSSQNVHNGYGNFEIYQQTVSNVSSFIPKNNHSQNRIGYWDPMIIISIFNIQRGMRTKDTINPLRHGIIQQTKMQFNTIIIPHSHRLQYCIMNKTISIKVTHVCSQMSRQKQMRSTPHTVLTNSGVK